MGLPKTTELTAIDAAFEMLRKGLAAGTDASGTRIPS
jgi:hypothetical protein